jgi:uncharacterized membrane protein
MKGRKDKKVNLKLKIALIFILLIAGILVLAFANALFGINIFSGEDSWICEQGEWVKHGVPSAPMPEELCK